MRSETYTVVSKMAYLTGVSQRIFELEAEPPKLEWYHTLEKNKSARIIRNLCILRTAIELHFKAIREAIKFDLKTIYTLPDLVPYESIRQLELDGITLKRHIKPVDYIIEINRYISDRLNNCKNLFPLWLKWDYIKQLFIMPDGLTESGTQAAAKDYYANKSFCPYHVYLNWNYKQSGNLFANDRRFVTLLYEAQGDYFSDISKVSDAGDMTKSGIYNFLEYSKRTAMVVDCENADPYKLYATLNNLDQNALLEKIVKIILYNDIHAPTAWKILDRFTEIPIEHNMIDRVKDNKSLVDIRLTTGTCREFFQNETDSFILVSSDSDYWGLISSIPEARFFVLVESEKCSPSIKQAMENAGISYCYMDDFCTGNSNTIKIQAVLKEVQRTLDAHVNFNINIILQNAYIVTRADMTTAEQEQFYQKYIKPMRLLIGEDGKVKIELGPLY